MNSIGNQFKLTLIGSSHGSLVGVVIDGFPAGEKIDLNQIQKQLDCRRPGQSKITTRRKEPDRLIIESGLFNEHTTGEPIVAYVRNNDIDSSYYTEIVNTPRPGHADFPAQVKYQHHHDYRGGGRFSGRLTIGIVIAGSIAMQYLNNLGIKVQAYTRSIASITVNDDHPIDDEMIYAENNLVRTSDPSKIDEMIEMIDQHRKNGDSVGGIVECVITNLPVGVGEPWFDSIESKISHFMFSIPAVKGVEFGSGFRASTMTGRTHNDEFYIENDVIKTKTNNAGGILGGLSNGMPVVFRVAFKPTSSISQQQKTVDLNTKEVVNLKVRGRHDPCIVPRAVPVVSNAAACVILDLLFQGGFQIKKGDIK